VLGTRSIRAPPGNIEFVSVRVLLNPFRVLRHKGAVRVNRVTVDVYVTARVPRGSGIEIRRIDYHPPEMLLHPLLLRKSRGVRVSIEGRAGPAPESHDSGAGLGANHARYKD